MERKLTAEDQLDIFELSEKGAEIKEEVPGDESKLIEVFLQHLKKPQHRIEMEPMATPRPRFRTFKSKYTGEPVVSTYHPAEYTRYKEALKNVILGRIRSGELAIAEYSILMATFYFPYPQSTPKKRLIDNAPMQVKPDWDNLAKGVQDGMADASLMDGGDSRIASALILKRRTLEPEGYFTFTIA